MTVLSEYKSMINCMIDEGLTYKMVASALNLSPDTVRRIDGRYPLKKLKSYKARILEKHKRVSNIDHDKFVKLWCNGATYESLSNLFGITVRGAMNYKYRNCKGIKRQVICRCCGKGFETKHYSRTVCTGCSFESTVNYFNHKRWIERINEGTRILREKMLRCEEIETLRKIKEEKKELEDTSKKPWWWEDSEIIR